MPASDDYKEMKCNLSSFYGKLVNQGGNMIVERKYSRSCRNCVYSVFCNERWLCIKQGITVQANDLCDCNIRRFVVIYEEVKPDDVSEISIPKVDSEVQQVDVPPHMPVMQVQK